MLRSMSVHLRIERPEDYRESEELVRDAFWNCYAPGCNEHYLLHIMRNSPNFVPELDYIAVLNGRIVGIITFMKSVIVADNGECHEVLTLGPIAVKPECQRMGIGKMLIVHTRTIAAQLDYRAILLCGDPEYYQKTGFVAAEKFNIRTSENKYFAALLAYPLFVGGLSGISGRYYEDEIYNVDLQKSEDFDRSFPKKERISGTPTQRRFEEILAMQRMCE